MAAATAARGLSAKDLESIRATLASGRKPRVMFTVSAGQIAGQTGQVVDLRDPRDDEWVVVRFGHDELPFSPTDLAIPPRAAPVKRAPAARARKPEPEATVPAVEPDEPVAEPATVIPPQRQEAPMTDSTTADPTTDGVPDPASARPARKAAAPRAPKVRPPAALTITLAYTDGEWSVGAQQGAKALAKPYMIKAQEALKMVALLDVPGVHEAVEQIIAAERAENMAHADRLRAELAEIEARLADLSGPR